MTSRSERNQEVNLAPQKARRSKTNCRMATFQSSVVGGPSREDLRDLTRHWFNGALQPQFSIRIGRGGNGADYLDIYDSARELITAVEPSGTGWNPQHKCPHAFYRIYIRRWEFTEDHRGHEWNLMGFILEGEDGDIDKPKGLFKIYNYSTYSRSADKIIIRY